MITVTDTHTGAQATINTYDFTETVTPWFPDAPADVIESIAATQAQLNRGEFIADSALDSLGLDISILEK